jgi:hypothetical protein
MGVGVVADLHRAEHARHTGRGRIGRETASLDYLNRVRLSGPFLKPIVKHCEAIN